MDNPMLKMIAKIIPISPALESDFLMRISSKTLKKNEILLKPGQVCKYMYFIVKGLLRAYYERDYDEKTNWLLMENDFATSILSYYRQKISTETIHALEDTELLCISYDDMKYLYKTHVELNIAGLEINNIYLCKIEERYEWARFNTAKEQYMFFMATKPDLVKRVSNKHIASYLGMKHETLSRVKRNINQKIL